MSTGGATALQQENERHYEFKNLTEAIETASYIEKLLDAERLWIANRSSWLFMSQSFLLVAFVTFLGFDRQNLGPWTIRILPWALALLWVAWLWAVRFDSSRHWPM